MAGPDRNVQSAMPAIQRKSMRGDSVSKKHRICHGDSIPAPSEGIKTVCEPNARAVPDVQNSRIQIAKSLCCCCLQFLPDLAAQLVRPGYVNER